MLLLLLLGPIFLYPAFYGATLLADTLLGEQQVLHYLLVQSKRFVWDSFWADWLVALPFSYGVLVPTTLLITWVVKLSNLRPTIVCLLVFISAALLLAIAVLHGQFVLLAALTAIFLWVPAAILLRMVKS